MEVAITQADGDTEMVGYSPEAKVLYHLLHLPIESCSRLSRIGKHSLHVCTAIPIARMPILGLADI